MNFLQILSFGLDVYKRFHRKQIGKDTYKQVASFFRDGCSKEEWIEVGYHMGVINPE